MTKVFIDGSAGTTGLRLRERLSARADISLTLLGDELRKDSAARAEAIAAADIAFLCLPDDAARESVALAAGTDTRIIDTSTAHRTDERFAYGFPELSETHREKIASGRLIAVPGCHASGFIALAYPLVTAGLAGRDYPFSCTSLTGYSGGGKSMIAEYTAQPRSEEYSSPRVYALSQAHKHLPEMQFVTGIYDPPVFAPTVADFYSGMLVTVPLFPKLLKRRAGLSEIAALYEKAYAGCPMISVVPGRDGMLAANAFSGRDDMEISVTGNDERMLLCARFDNLGKGASGAAIQCMNIMLGLPEKTGLDTGEKL